MATRRRHFTHTPTFLCCALLAAGASIQLRAGSPPIAEAAPATVIIGHEAPLDATQPIETEDHTISLARLQNAPPPKAARLFTEGWDEYKQGHTRTAIRKLKKALRIHPNFVEAHNNLGYLFLTVERLDDAVQHFNAAIRLDPTFNSALLNLALALYARGDVVQALKVADQAVQQEPNSSRAHYVAGLLLLRSSVPDEDKQALGHLIEASNDFPMAKVMAAYEMLRLNRPDQAQQALFRYLKDAPLR